MSGFTKKCCYEIFIGMKDKDTYTESPEKRDYVQKVSKFFEENKIDYTLSLQTGGYSHNKGYVIETSICVQLLNLEEETIIDIAKKLKELVNTDTVMITKAYLDTTFI